MRSDVSGVLLLISSILLLQPAPASSQVHTWRRYFAGPTLTVGINPQNPSTVFAPGPSGILYVSYDGGRSWTGRGSPGLPDVRQIIVHPSDTTILFAAGSGGGLRRSTDGGMTWNVALGGLGIDGESVTLDTQRPDTMIAGNFDDGKVYRSTDSGLRWELQGSPGTLMCSMALRTDSTKILYAGTGSGTISKSTDGGGTWRRVKSGGSEEIPKIVIDPGNPMIAYAAAYEGPANAVGVWKTVDGGEHWALTALQGVSVWSLDISRSDLNTVYAGSFSDSHAAVFRTSDGGASWDTLSSGFPLGGNAWSLKVHPLNGDVIWLAVTGGIRGGIYRWVPSRATIQGVVRDGSSNDAIMNGFAQLLSTGETTQLMTTAGHFAFNYFDGDSLHAGIRVEAYPYYIHDDQVTFTLDSTVRRDIFLRRLQRASINGSVRAAASGMPLQATITVTSSSSLGMSRRSAETNSNGDFLLDSLYISYPPLVSYEGIFIDPVFPFAQKTYGAFQLDSAGLAVQPRLPPADVLVAFSAGAGDYQQYYRAALDSARVTSHIWNVAEHGPAPLSRAREVLKHAAIFYTGMDTAALSPVEASSLIECVNNRCNLFVTGQDFVEKNQSSAFVRSYAGVMYGGNIATPFCKGDAENLLAGARITTSGGTGANNQTSRDALIITNPGAKPIVEYGPAGDAGIAGIRNDSVGAGGKIVLFGFGFEAINSASSRCEVIQRIIGYFDGSLTVGVDGGFSPSLPSEFSLSQNYPNPANPSTVIRYGVPHTSYVRLTIYDMLGQKVALLVDEQRTAGTYVVAFQSDGLASGVYFYRMEAEGFAQTRKLLLLH